MFTHAIVRPPARNFADGITTAGLGAPDFELALAQHAVYCQALQQCGLQLTVLDADPRYPDSTFVEDTAILTPQHAILTNPGADSRKGELDAIRQTLAGFYDSLDAITPPGTVDGGDICEADGHYFIGISERTNQAGAAQLAQFLSQVGYTSTFMDARGIPGLLHLKSGIAYLGDDTLVLVPALAGSPLFDPFEHKIIVPAEEFYAANCVRVNAYVLVAAGFPWLVGMLAKKGFQTIALDMSEYQKMDGGLSCLSLRF